MRMADPGPIFQYASVACVIPLVSRVSPIPELFEIAEIASEVVLSAKPTKNVELIALQADR